MNPDRKHVNSGNTHGSRFARRQWRVVIDRDFVGGRVPRVLIERVLLRVGRGEKRQGEVRVIVVDDRTMRRLNRRFRRIDRPTDVLAFPRGLEFPCPVDRDLVGEVYCNYDHARRWQRRHGGTLFSELARLAVHGCLHLLGYDHHSSRERRRMAAREDRYLTDTGLMSVRGADRSEDAD